jgi:hypothetical protein
MHLSSKILIKSVRLKNWKIFIYLPCSLEVSGEHDACAGTAQPGRHHDEPVEPHEQVGAGPHQRHRCEQLGSATRHLTLNSHTYNYRGTA